MLYLLTPYFSLTSNSRVDGNFWGRATLPTSMQNPPDLGDLGTHQSWLNQSLCSLSLKASVSPPAATGGWIQMP